MAAKFEPKVPVDLDPPKDDPITVEELSKANGRPSHLRCSDPRGVSSSETFGILVRGMGSLISSRTL